LKERKKERKKSRHLAKFRQFKKRKEKALGAYLPVAIHCLRSSCDEETLRSQIDRSIVLSFMRNFSLFRLLQRRGDELEIEGFGNNHLLL
jgi:hypothetical protein